MSLTKIFLTIIILCFGITSCKDFQSNDLAFDQNDWKRGDFRVRGRMSSSLSNQKILIGKTRDELIEILGEPDEADPSFVKYNVDRGTIFERWLQKYYLVIIFGGEKNTVGNIAVVD